MAGLPPALNLSPLVYAPVLTKNTAQFSEITPARARVETACHHACHTILVSNRATVFFFSFSRLHSCAQELFEGGTRCVFAGNMQNKNSKDEKTCSSLFDEKTFHTHVKLR